MRLTCPNCDAQYEVPDEVVPTAGRDVQCSNCGKTWFQFHPDHEPQVKEERDVELSPTAPAPDDEVSPAQAPPAPSEDAGPKRRQLDPAVADILRQEAEVEYEARRRRQSQGIESQPDLGLEAAEPPTPPAPPAPVVDQERRAEEAKQRTARMRGEADNSPDAEAAAAAAAISSRRELLPDIEEINSTLRNDASPHGVDADAREGIGAGGERKQKRGFRRGFMTILLLFVIMVLIYVFAAQIAQTIPALEDVLAAYVAWVDQLRLTLDSWLTSMLGTLDSIADESSK